MTATGDSACKSCVGACALVCVCVCVSYSVSVQECDVSDFDGTFWREKDGSREDLKELTAQ